MAAASMKGREIACNTSMMAGVAGRYASALLETANEQGQLAAIEADIDTVQGALAESDDLRPVMTTEGKPLKEYVEAFERMLIDNTMRRHSGSIAAVMEELCLPRRTLNEKMAKYGLQRQDYL